MGKAASYQVSCGCQCSNLSFRDSWGKSHGNCKSADATGALWCYVDPYNSDCNDLAYSNRAHANPSYNNKRWSYQACDTPPLSDPRCGYGGGYNNGGYNNGGYNDGGYTNGGYNNGYNNGYNQGSSNCRNGRCGSSGSYVGSGSYGGSGS